MNRFFVEIDATKFERDGEVALIDTPKSWESLLDSLIEKPPKGNFSISRQDQLGTFIKVVGGAHGAVAKYIVQQKSGRNELIISNRELAAATGVSLASTNQLLQRLRAADCIRCRTGALMVNPGISHKGNRQRERFLMKLYQDFENKSKAGI